MSTTSLYLSADDLWAAVAGIDAVSVVIDELLTMAAGDLGWARDGSVRLAPWSDREPRDGRPGELAALDDLATGDRCLLPRDGLRAVRVAALTALAAQRLLNEGVVTAAVLGCGPWAQMQTSLIVRHVPAISHVAVQYPATRVLLSQLERAGTGFSVAAGAASAVRGANLVAVLGPDATGLEAADLCHGAVLVNGAGHPLPRAVATRADQIYVEDRALGAGGPLSSAPGDGSRPADADLVQVITGAYPGRADVDDVVLVELLSAACESAELAYQICQVAYRCGIGRRTRS